MSIPAKFAKRAKENLKKYQVIIADLKKKDANETDTVRVVAGILECIFGYNRFNEVTSEYAIGGTYCDLAIVDARKKIKLLIEVKSASTSLKENHIKQAVDYGANAGVSWVILTNAERWLVYRIKFGKPIDKEFVYEINFSNINPKSDKDVELLYTLSKEGQGKSAMEDFYSTIQVKNKFIIGNLLTNDEVYSLIRRNLKILYSEIKITNEEIGEIITEDVIKREILDSDESRKAKRDINKSIKKHTAARGEKLEQKRKAAKRNERAGAKKAAVDEIEAKEVIQ